MHRHAVPELLDVDAGTPAEVRASLLDLRWINRWFGGVRTSRILLEDALRQSSLREASLLSVAAGDGWSAAQTAAELSRRGFRIYVTVLDRSNTHLRDSPVRRRIVGDALRLPLADNSYDFVESSLFAHHLEPEELRTFVREGLRVARRAVLINDLRREWPGYILARLGCLVYRSRITRHDAPASVRRAYTVREMRDILAGGENTAMRVSTFWFCRMGVIAWRKPGR